MNFVRAALSFAAVAFTSVVIGIGAGFVQALLISRGWDRMEQAAFSSTVALAAGILGLLIGLLTYYVIFRRKLPIDTMFSLCAMSILSGWFFAWLLSIYAPHIDWISGAAPPATALLSSGLYAHHLRRNEIAP